MRYVKGSKSEQCQCGVEEVGMWGRGQSVVEPHLTHIFWLERQARLLWLGNGKVALWSTGMTWLLSGEWWERGKGTGRGGAEYCQHLHVDSTQTNAHKVHRKSWPECIRFAFIFLFYFIYDFCCCCCCCLLWCFLCFSGLEFESLSKAHLTVQCECTHECFLEAPSSLPLLLPLPSLLFNVY